MTIKQVTIGTGDTALVDAPTSGSYASVGVYLCNYSAAAVTVQVYVLTAAGSSADANSFMRDLVLQPKESFFMNSEKLILGANCSVVAKASAGSAVVSTATYIAI